MPDRIFTGSRSRSTITSIGRTICRSSRWRFTSTFKVMNRWKELTFLHTWCWCPSFLYRDQRPFSSFYIDGAVLFIHVIFFLFLIFLRLLLFFLLLFFRFTLLLLLFLCRLLFPPQFLATTSRLIFLIFFFFLWLLLFLFFAFLLLFLALILFLGPFLSLFALLLLWLSTLFTLLVRLIIFFLLVFIIVFEGLSGFGWWQLRDFETMRPQILKTLSNALAVTHLAIRRVKEYEQSIDLGCIRNGLSELQGLLHFPLSKHRRIVS